MGGAYSRFTETLYIVPGERRRFWTSESQNPRSHFFRKITSDFVGTRIVHLLLLPLQLQRPFPISMAPSTSECFYSALLATHVRCGSESPLRVLPTSLFRHIFMFLGALPHPSTAVGMNKRELLVLLRAAKVPHHGGRPHAQLGSPAELALARLPQAVAGALRVALESGRECTSSTIVQCIFPDTQQTRLPQHTVRSAGPPVHRTLQQWARDLAALVNSSRETAWQEPRLTKQLNQKQLLKILLARQNPAAVHDEQLMGLLLGYRFKTAHQYEGEQQIVAIVLLGGVWYLTILLVLSCC